MRVDAGFGLFNCDKSYIKIGSFWFFQDVWFQELSKTWKTRDEYIFVFFFAVALLTFGDKTCKRVFL